MDWIKSWTIRWLSVEKLMLLNYGSGEKSWEFLELQGDQTSQSYRKSVLNVHCKDWCWIWSSKTLATWCRYLTHLKRFWCWEKWKAGGEGDDKGWDSWVASLTQWTWVWASSGSWWLTGKPGELQSMGSQRIRHNWTTELTDWHAIIIALLTKIGKCLSSFFICAISSSSHSGKCSNSWSH